MSATISFTLDLEDLRTSETQELRLATVTHSVLDLLAEHEVTASIYVVGDLVADHVGLVRRIADDGHELGLHSWSHVPLSTLEPESLLSGLVRGRDLLEQTSGTAVSGYRAPMMSLVPRTSWALDVIGEAGFSYSSSILPVTSPMYGWPGLPRQAFRWSNGLVELPCPVVTLGPVTVPYLGGTYLRLLPGLLRRYGVRRARPGEVLWAYCHPWEFDPAEPFYRYDHASWLTSRIGWLNRRGMTRRVRRMLDGGSGPPLGEVAADLAAAGTLEMIDIDEAAANAAEHGESRAARLFRTVEPASSTVETVSS